MRSLFAEAERRGTPVVLHPARPVTLELLPDFDMAASLGMMFDTTIALCRLILSGVLEEHPNLKLVCPHVGGVLPYLIGRLDYQVLALKRGGDRIQRAPRESLKRVWFDTVTGIGLGIQFAKDFAGADKLMYGSDHPWIDPQYNIDALDSVALTEAERQTLEHHPQETQNQIVRELLRRKIDLLDRLSRPEEIQDVMHQMVLCERGDSASLTELVDWLAKRKAWTVVDEVSTRFAASFEADALLLYTLCEARVAQGNRESAERGAEQAIKLSGDSALEHKSVAKALLERGLTEWSDRELRYIIQLGPIASPLAIEARLNLSQSLHDRALDRQAAEALQGLIEAMDTDMNVVLQVREILQSSPDRPPGMLRARYFHYLSCDAESQKDIAKQREYLDKALEQDKADVDVLISAYRLSAADAKWHADVIDLVKKAVDDTRRAIEDAPDEPTNYNQLAWLVANTEGDLEEAIRLSQKSVDVARASATTQEEFRQVSMYLDTLAHCYFAQKDFENAVKYQAEAVKLDPHSAPIGRQLKTFRKALAEAQAGSGK